MLQTIVRGAEILLAKKLLALLMRLHLVLLTSHAKLAHLGGAAFLCRHTALKIDGRPRVLVVLTDNRRPRHVVVLAIALLWRDVVNARLRQLLELLRVRICHFGNRSVSHKRYDLHRLCLIHPLLHERILLGICT